MSHATETKAPKPIPTFSPVGGNPNNAMQVGMVDLHNMTTTLRNEYGELVTMDLSPADVHIPSAMPNYAAGYKLEGCIADQVSEPVVVAKNQDYFFTWDKKVAFQPAQGLQEGPGGVLPEISPTLGSTQYTTKEYVISCFMRTETIANADGVLNPDVMAMMLCLNKLKIAREQRVSTLLTTTGTWDSSVRLALGAGQNWNGGASSDPLANIRTIMRASLQGVTGIAMNRAVWDAFTFNSQVQKYIQFKAGIPGVPNTEQMNGPQALQNLPKNIFVSDARALSSAGTYDYIWPNSVVLLRDIPGMPIDQQTISSNKTFRWLGGNDMVKDRTSTTPEGYQVFNGWMVRKFWNHLRGARGGMTTIVCHNDIETQTSDIVGGLITGVLA